MNKQTPPIKQKFFGSIISRLNSYRCYKKEDEPTVGMGATKHLYSDCHACTVSSVEKNWKNKGFDIVSVQRDEAIAHRDEKDNLTYTYKRNPNAGKYYYKGLHYKHDDGTDTKVYLEVRWNEKTNRWNNASYHNTCDMTFGDRREYYDPSF